MRNSYYLFFIGVFIIGVSSCMKDDNSNNISIEDSVLQELLNTNSNGVGNNFFKLPNSSDYASIPQDPQNPLTEAKVTLGQLLFHETALALNPKHLVSTGTYSCASCHFAGGGFQANRQQGISDGGIGFGINGEARTANPTIPVVDCDVQPIRTPSAMNGAYQKNMLWNGQFGATGLNVGTQAQWTAGTPKETNHLGYEGLEIQAIAGLGVHRMKIDSTFIHSTAYKQFFDDAFPNFAANERYTLETAGLAIAAYERTILANRAPFQKWLRGNYNALPSAQKHGAILFFGKAKCVNCHTGPALNKMEFAAIGMKDLYQFPGLVINVSPTDDANLGRGGFTQDQNDNYKFKIPQLYNLKNSPFYGHGSSFKNIRKVIEYKNNAIAENSSVPQNQISSEFQPLNLTDKEIDQLTNFVKNGLYDPELMRYQPGTVVSGNCIPNNDYQSKIDLGCQ